MTCALGHKMASAYGTPMSRPAASFDEIRALADGLPEWNRASSAPIEHSRLVLFAAAHGIAADLPGGSPKEMAEAVESLTGGRSALHGLVEETDCDLRLYELALHLPTRDLRRAPAMDAADVARAAAYGMMAVEPGIEVFVVAALGVGADLAGAALLRALLEEGAESDPLDRLAALGGPDIAAILGVILAARLAGAEIILDGPAALAAAAVAQRLRPEGLDHCRLAAGPSRFGLDAILSGPDEAPLSGVRALAVLKSARPT